MQVVANGFWKTFDLDHDLSGGRATVDPFNGRRRQWFRRRTRGRSCDETAGIESREIVVTRCLEIVAEERGLLNHHLTVLVFCGFMFLAALLRVVNEGVQC